MPEALVDQESTPHYHRMNRDDESPTLNPGHRIFSDGGPASDVAVLGSLGDADYALSYKHAAEILVEKATNGEMAPDLLFLPIAFLYRHWTELAIKSLIRQAGGEGGDEHDLAKLYRMLQKLGRELEPSSASALQSVDPLERIMSEWSKHDKGGTSFRYATSLSDKYSLPALFFANVVEMAETMKAVQGNLDAWSGWLSDFPVQIGPASEEQQRADRSKAVTRARRCLEAIGWTSDMSADELLAKLEMGGG